MKKILYVIIAIGVLYIVLALFGKPDVKVERQISISKPAEVIMPKLTDLKFFHDQWSPWTEKDTAMVTNYSGEPGKIGHKMDWSGNKNVGTGSMEITNIKNDSIIMKLVFKGKGESKGYYIVSGKDKMTNVTWGLEMKIPFFARPVMMFMNMDKMMAPDFENGLAKLKKVMEETKEESVASYEIKEIEWPETNYIGKKETLTFDKLAEFFGKNYSAISAELGKNKIQAEGPPSSIYWTFDQQAGKTEVAAVFKVAKGTKLKGYESFSFPASKVLQLVYNGGYSKIGDAHMALGKYMKDKALTQNVAVEEYITDPMTEKDSTKWQTNIYYLLK
jgi:effector-binding domain-containing protein